MNMDMVVVMDMDIEIGIEMMVIPLCTKRELFQGELQEFIPRSNFTKDDT